MDSDQGQGGYEGYGWGDYGTSQDDTATDRQSPYAMAEDTGYYGAPYAADGDSNPYAYAYGFPESNAYNEPQGVYGDVPSLGNEPPTNEEPPGYQLADTCESEVSRLEDPEDDVQPQEVGELTNDPNPSESLQNEMFGFGDNLADGASEAAATIEPDNAFGFFGFDDAPSTSAAISEANAADLAAFSDATPVITFSDYTISSAPISVSRLTTPSDSVFADVDAPVALSLEPETASSAHAEDSAALLEHLRRVRKMLVIDQILRLRAAVGADRVFRDIQPQQLASVESREEISVAVPQDESLQQLLSEEPQSSQEVVPLHSFSNIGECASDEATPKLQADPDTERSIREAEAIIEEALMHTPEVKDLESLPDMATAPLSDAPETLEDIIATEQHPECLSNKVESDSFERIQDSELIDELKSEMSQWGQQPLEEHSHADSICRQATPNDSMPNEIISTDLYDQEDQEDQDQAAYFDALVVDRIATPDTLDDILGPPESLDACQEDLHVERQETFEEHVYKSEDKDTLQVTEGEQRASGDEELDDFDIELARREAEMLEQARREEEEMLRQAEEDLYRQEEEQQEVVEEVDHVVQEELSIIARLDSPAISAASLSDGLCVDRLDSPAAEVYSVTEHVSKPCDKHKAEHPKHGLTKEKHHAVKQKEEKQKEEKTEKHEKQKPERAEKADKAPKHEVDKAKTSTIKKKPKPVEQAKEAVVEKPHEVAKEETPTKPHSAAKSATETSHIDKKPAKKQQKSKKAPVEQELSTTVSSVAESSQDEDIISAKRARDEARLQEKLRKQQEQLQALEGQKRHQEEEELQRILAEEKLRMDKEIERATRKADREYQKLEMEKKRFAISSQIESRSATASGIETSGSLLSDKELMRELRLRERRDKELQALRHNIEASMEKESDSADYDPSLQTLSAVRRHSYGATSSLVGRTKHKDGGRHVSSFVDTSSYSNFYVKVLSHRTVIISGTRPFISYYIEFGMDGRKFRISCRFSEVKELHAAISAAYPATTLPNLPPDRPYALGGWKPEFIKERAKLLEAYLYSMHSITFVRTSNIYRQFLKAARC